MNKQMQVACWASPEPDAALHFYLVHASELALAESRSWLLKRKRFIICLLSNHGIREDLRENTKKHANPRRCVRKMGVFKFHIREYETGDVNRLLLASKAKSLRTRTDISILSDSKLVDNDRVAYRENRAAFILAVSVSDRGPA